jgi:hypothetical protein
MESINDRLELWTEIEVDAMPEVFAATVFADDAEITDLLACAVCVGECKVY